MSAREAEVLELVGASLTNAQIAARLFISVRTVESHVSALLRKLDLPDRRALAAYVARTEPGADGVLRGAPEAFTSFVGRRDDLARVAAALDSARLVTLTGPGGIGKTRLAIEAGRRAGGGAKWFVDLVPARSELVITTIATTIGVVERPNQSLEEAIHEAVAERPSLVILDNCEHVLDAAATATQRLLQACPDAVVLATSREVLGVPGEQVVPVRPLAVYGTADGATALFVVRARAAGAALAADDHEMIAEICARLDGIPLAVELAAARCATLGVDGVLHALNDRFRLLAGARGIDERHRSLRAVLDWSYGLLDADEQSVWRRVAVFQGGFGVADASAIAGSDADAVARLAAKSLVVHGRDERGRSTYRLLETLRAYGLERLAEAGEVERVRDLHLDWALGIATELEREMETHDAVPDRLDAVFDDLRAALAWADEHRRRAAGHLLACRAAHLAYGRRFVSEAQRMFRVAAEYAASDATAARVLLDAAHAAFAILRGDLGYECLLDAADRAMRAGDLHTAAFALALATERGNRFPGEFATVPDRETLQTLRARAGELVTDDDDGPSGVQLALATAWLSVTSATSDTEPIARRALSAARRLGDPVFESSALDALSASAWQSGRLADSAQICTDRVALLDRMAMHEPRTGNEQLDILHMASDVPLARGDLPRALAFARDAMRHPAAVGAPHIVQRELVAALCLTGSFDDALLEAAGMRAVWERSGRPTAGWMAPAAFLTALVYGLRGERDEFDAWYALGDEVCLAPDNAARTFVTVRLALHEGRLDDAVTAIDQHRAAAHGRDSDFPWSLAAIGYEGYLWSVAAEVWVEAGAIDAVDHLRELHPTLTEHLWSRACLQRAEGRRLEDPSLVRAAAAAFAAIDARFEEAATLALLDGDERAAGLATLAVLGCTTPL